MARPLAYEDGPLVWVDCEMTGLDLATDRIIEIAVIVTDGQLVPVDEGITYVIRTERAVLDAMGEWCTDQHGRSGLTQACLDSPHTYADVTARVVDYIRKWIPERGAGILAGSTVHADMRFLLVGMPEVMQHLGYRIVDVSSVKELACRWNPEIIQLERARRTGESSHRALDDIRASIRELEFYRAHFFNVVPGPKIGHDAPLKTAL
ncbi:Phosphatidylinositol 3,4,5-trisphosphate-dependent Rac exchanger 2 protein [Cryptotrichosporon argae]